MAAFSDLNIVAVQRDISEIVRLSLKLGYDCIALNTFVPELVPITKRKKEQEKVTIPPPYRHTPDEETRQQMQIQGRTLKQLSRISVVLTDPGQTRKLVGPEVQAYDLISVQPSCEKTLQLACSTLDIDIISVDMTQRIPFYLKRQMINMAIERGLHFEIKYSPTLFDSTMRRNTISNAISLVEICKGKNIIITSGCERAIDLRSPYDVSVLGCLLGLSFAQAKEAITKNCRAVVLHSQMRKMVKSTVALIKTPLGVSRAETDQGEEAAAESGAPPTKKMKTSQFP